MIFALLLLFVVTFALGTSEDGIEDTESTSVFPNIVEEGFTRGTEAPEVGYYRREGATREVVAALIALLFLICGAFALWKYLSVRKHSSLKNATNSRRINKKKAWENEPGVPFEDTFRHLELYNSVPIQEAVEKRISISRSVFTLLGKPTGKYTINDPSKDSDKRLWTETYTVHQRCEKDGTSVAKECDQIIDSEREKKGIDLNESTHTLADNPNFILKSPNKHLENLSRFVEKTEAEMNNETIKSTESSLFAKYFSNVQELSSPTWPKNCSSLVSTPIANKNRLRENGAKLDVIYETAISTSPNAINTTSPGNLTFWKTDIPATPDDPISPRVVTPCAGVVTPTYSANASKRFTFGSPKKEIVFSPIVERALLSHV